MMGKLPFWDLPNSLKKGENKMSKLNGNLSIFNQLKPVSVGFENMFDNFEKLFEADDFGSSMVNYPPYNIVKTGDFTYDIEVALAGFSKKDISIEYADGLLKIKSVKEQIDANNLPKHIAVIMDGNGRWAKQKGFTDRIFGHRNAIKAVRETIEGCGELGVSYLTLYAFSTENWNRPQSEVKALMSLLRRCQPKCLRQQAFSSTIKSLMLMYSRVS